MNKTQLIKEIHNKCHPLTIKQCDLVLQEIIALMTEVLSQGEEIRLPGFGKFYCSHYKEHVGHNPKTREKIIIKDKKVVKFKEWNVLKYSVNNV